MGSGGGSLTPSKLGPAGAPNGGSWAVFRRKPARAAVPVPGSSSAGSLVPGSGDGPATLPRVLTVRDLITLGVGSTVGAGIYVLIGSAAREHAGPWLPLSFLMAGTAAAFSAFCYAELACRCPSAGSAYAYAYQFLGEGPAFLVGWALALEYTVGAAAVARGFGPNLASLLTGQGSERAAGSGAVLMPPPSALRLSMGGMEVDLLAAVLVAAAAALLCSGIRQSARAQAALMAANLAVLGVVILVGIWIGAKTGWQGHHASSDAAGRALAGGPGAGSTVAAAVPHAAGGTRALAAAPGLSGVVGGAAMVFFAYVGFDSVATTAEELKHPQRDLPVGILGSLSICAGLYMTLAAIVTGLVPSSSLSPDTPISGAFAAHGAGWVARLVNAGALAALATALMGSLLPQPRVLMAMARDGLLPAWLGAISPASGTPVNATVAAGAVAAGLACFVDIEVLSGMVSLGTLLAFTAAGASVLVLRYAPPQPGSAGRRGPARGWAVMAIGAVCGGPLLGAAAAVEAAWVPASGATPAAGGGVSGWVVTGATLALGGLAGLYYMGEDGEPAAAAAQGAAAGFQVPFSPLLPSVCVAVNIYLLASLSPLTWAAGGTWLSVGLLLYLLWGLPHAHLGRAGDGGLEPDDEKEVGG